MLDGRIEGGRGKRAILVLWRVMAAQHMHAVDDLTLALQAATDADVMCQHEQGKMDVDYSKITDFEAWIALAKEVEPLFGPMADEMNFREAVKHAISNHTAFCIRSAPNEKDKTLKGGIVISTESNEIAWLAVSEKYRRKGYGRQLLKFAIRELNPRERILVQTFDETVTAGKSARKLYIDFGFTDLKDGGLNPAGVPTVIMQLSGSELVST